MTPAKSTPNNDCDTNSLTAFAPRIPFPPFAAPPSKSTEGGRGRARAGAFPLLRNILLKINPQCVIITDTAPNLMVPQDAFKYILLLSLNHFPFEQFILRLCYTEVVKAGGRQLEFESQTHHFLSV